MTVISLIYLIYDLIYVGDHFGDFVELAWVADYLLEKAKGGGVIITVAYTLVKHEFEVEILLFLNCALGVKLIYAALRSKGEKHRARTEVIQMMIDRRYAKRAH